MNNYIKAINQVAEEASDINDDVVNSLLSRWENILDEEEDILFI